MRVKCFQPFCSTDQVKNSKLFNFKSNKRVTTNECCAFNVATRCSCKKFNTSLIWKAQPLSLLLPGNTPAQRCCTIQKQQHIVAVLPPQPFHLRKRHVNTQEGNRAAPSTGWSLFTAQGKPKGGWKEDTHDTELSPNLPLPTFFFLRQDLLCSSGWSLSHYAVQASKF